MEAVAEWATAVAEAVETAVGESEKRLSRSSSSSSDGEQMLSRGSPKEVLKSSGKTIAPTQETNIIFIPEVMDKTLILSRNNSSNNNNNSTVPSTVSILDIGGGANVGYQKLAQDEQDLYLQTLHKLPDFHNFYCPNCKSCITKVIILRDGSSSLPGPDGGASPLPPSIEEVTETPRSPRLNVIERAPVDLEISPEKEGGSIRCSNCFSFLAPIGAWISSQLGVGQGIKPAISDDQLGGADPTTPRRGSILPRIFSRANTQGSGSIAIPIPPSDEREESGGKSLEIVKSIVYGGLTEAITSLGIVTSAASANTPTENIVALALANLITGLIVLTNNLSGLKSNQVKKESNETNEPHVDPYKEALGDRDHYLLHYTISILSFLLFGLLPPLVYGFSFRDTDDADLKLAAVAVTSLLCIALLAIAKAYVSKQHTWKEFAKTLVYYITLGFGASGLSYLAGKEFNVLLEQLGWFKKDPMAPTLLLPIMNHAKPTWGSI